MPPLRDDRDLLAAFHRQIRMGVGEGPARTRRERVGWVARHTSTDPEDRWAMVDCPEGLGDDPDAVIAGERDHFRALGLPLEWKTYSYDDPPDLGDRLVRAGFVKEDDEALMLGDLAVLAAAAEAPLEVPAGITIRESRTRGDARRTAELYELVWGGAWGRADRDASGDEDPLPPGDPTELKLIAQASPSGDVVCAGRVTLAPGTDFAGLWGGSTHPDWRRRGLFRALLAERARWAMSRGFTLARVDASPDSEPILRSLGLRRVATTSPYTLPRASPDSALTPPGPDATSGR
jgi:GNAT superfamily N-acetyltransferase